MRKQTLKYGANSFVSFVLEGHPEWIVIAVKAPIEKVARHYKKIIEVKDWLKDVPVQSKEVKGDLLGPPPLLRLKGSEWTIIYHSMNMPIHSFKGALDLAQKTSSKWNTVSAVFIGEDTTFSVMGLFVFRQGKKIREHYWEDQAEDTTKVFAEFKLRIPPCYVSKSRKGICVIAPEDAEEIERADVLGDDLLEPPSKKSERQLSEEAEQIHKAAEKGDVRKLQQLLEKGVFIKAWRRVKNEGFTPLHSAAAAGRLNAVKFLIKAGSPAEPWVESEFFRRKKTPLTVACENGQAEVVKYLLRTGSDINSNFPGRYVPLTAAAKRGDVKLMRFLLGKGAKIPADALFWLVNDAKAEVIIELINAGANRKFKEEPSGETVLMKLCAAHPENQPWREQSRILEELLSKGADINETDLYGGLR